MTTVRDNTDALIGVVAVGVMLSLGGVFYAIADKSITEKAPLAASTPTPPQASASNILENPNTLENIFSVLKDNVVTPEQFDGLFSMAGVSGLPNPPDGWKYFRTKDGIGLKKAEKLSVKVK